MTALSLGATKIKIVGDSKLVINQVEGSFSVKEPSIPPYMALTQQWLSTFEEVEIRHIPSSSNQYVDVVATLKSSLFFMKKQP